MARAGAQAVLGAAVVFGLGIGAIRLERHVQAKQRFAGPPRIMLPDAPPELEAIIREHLQPVMDVDWIEPTLCRRIAARLRESAWVADVRRVRRLPEGRVEVRCRYRTPFVMVQTGGEFVLLDAERVRLPGRYPYSPTLPLIQGVEGTPPQAGQAWEAADLAAGVAVLTRLAREPFAGQVTAVLVHNHGGRRDPRSAHLELATDRAGGRIIWGSAPGEETEENTAQQKIAILRRNHELHGRIDAGLPVIDVSTFPDRFTTPARVRRAEKGQARMALLPV